MMSSPLGYNYQRLSPSNLIPWTKVLPLEFDYRYPPQGRTRAQIVARIGAGSQDLLSEPGRHRVVQADAPCRNYLQARAVLGGCVRLHRPAVVSLSGIRAMAHGRDFGAFYADPGLDVPSIADGEKAFPGLRPLLHAFQVVPGFSKQRAAHATESSE